MPWMNCRIKVSPTFLKGVKRLAKRYPSIKNDICRLAENLAEDPLQGTDLGGGIRKIRVRIQSKRKGKSGGGRIIYHCLIVSNSEPEIVLLTIYDKSEKETVTDAELKEILRRNGL